MRNEWGLTPNEESVAQAFMLSNNKIQSFADSMYDTSKFAKKSLEAKAFEHHAKPAMVQRIAQLKKEQAERTSIDSDWVLKEAVDLYRECRSENDLTQAVAALKLVANRVDTSDIEQKLLDLGGAVRIIQIVGMRGDAADSVVATQAKETIELNEDHSPAIHRPVRIIGV